MRFLKAKKPDKGGRSFCIVNKRRGIILLPAYRWDLTQKLSQVASIIGKNNRSAQVAKSGAKKRLKEKIEKKINV